jgi:hypothetical protein
MSAVKQILLVVCVQVSGVGCDQGTKSVERSVLPETGG